MKKKVDGLTRRQVLAGIAISSMSSVVGGSVLNQTNSSSQVFDSASSRSVRIEAKPEPIAMDTARTAVIVVDMQNDFGSKGGMFDRAGIDISMIQRAVGPTAKVLNAARKANIKIVYLKMGYKCDLIPWMNIGCGLQLPANRSVTPPSDSRKHSDRVKIERSYSLTIND